MGQSTLRPAAFVLTSTNHGSMLVNRFDYCIVGQGAFGVGHQLLSTSSFDPQEVDMVLQLLESRKDNYGTGVVALDCGANVGVHAVEWSKLMHDWGQVIAIEAQERIFYALAGNITMNNCFNCRAIWAAVGAKSGEIGVPVPDYFRPSSFGSLEIKKNVNNEFIGQEIDYENLQSTRMVPIDDLNLGRVDFIKIDIEGMEMEALQGAHRTIARCLPQLLIERIKSDSAEISEYLENLGYRLFALGINILAVHESDPISRQIQVSQ